MNRHQLELLNYSRYAVLVAGLYNRASLYLVVDTDGMLVWNRQAIPQGELAAALLELPAIPLIGDASTDPNDSQISSGLCRYVLSAADTPICEFVIELTCCSGHSEQCFPGKDNAVEGLQRALATVAEIVIEDVALLAELNAMADELSERYEELNLIYYTVDSVDHTIEGHVALEKIPVGCIRYLDVSSATILLPQKRLALIETNQHTSNADAALILAHLEQYLYPILTNNIDSIVCNSEKDYRKAGIANIGGKLVCSAIEDGAGNVCGMIALVRDWDAADFSNSSRNICEVMARKANKIVQGAYDHLTGLFSRSSLDGILGKLLAEPVAMRSRHSLMMIAIDQLGLINDAQGLEAGEALTKKCAQILQHECRGKDAAVRLGCDNLALLLYDCSEKNSAIVAEKLKKKLKTQTFAWAGQEYNITLSIGISSLAGVDSIGELLNNSKTALDLAKRNGGNREEYYVHDSIDARGSRNNAIWINRLQKALRNDLFELYAQPVFSVHDYYCADHFEILLRMLDDEGKPVSPGDFLPVAEHYGMMPMLDRWVIKASLELIEHSWAAMRHTECTWAINLSGQTLGDKAFKDYVIKLLNESMVPAQRIAFEITESTAISNQSDAIAFVASLREIGCAIYLDDFGTGVSGFSYLKLLPLDYIKIDGMFVRELLQDPLSRVTIKAITDVARELGLKTVAEYVENTDIADKCGLLGVDFLQGYGLGKPIPLVEALSQVSSRRLSPQSKCMPSP